MSFDVLVTKTAHLERTSSDAQVPAAWAVAEITRTLDGLPVDERASAMLTGWQGASVVYTHRRSDLEVAQDRLAWLVSALRQGEVSGLTPEQISGALQRVGA